MRSTIQFTCASLLTVLILFGCGRNPAPVPTGEEKDYREMLTRAEERKAEKTMHIEAQKAVQAFQTRYGRLPTNLFEVIRFGIIDSLPALPEGIDYSYDPRLGNVSLRKVEVKKKPEPVEPLPFEN